MSQSRSHRAGQVFLAALASLIVAGTAACTQTGAPPADRDTLLLLPVEPLRPMDRPCISLGNDGDFDSQHVFAPCVFEHDGGFRMLYCGSKPGDQRVFVIGIADSKDGLNWTKRPGGPVLAFGDNRTSLVTPAVLRGDEGRIVLEDGRLRMWVVAVDDGAEPQVHQLYETSSTDGGVTWAPLAGPMMKDVYAPCVLKVEDRYLMWYTDVSADPWSIRVARSSDGTHWEPACPDAALTVGQPWEKQRLFYPCVIREPWTNGARYLMWYGSYGSADADTTAIGLAVSDDGLYWQKYGSNPVITPDPSRDFESNYCTSHTVLPRCHEVEAWMKETPALKRAFTNRSRLCDGYQIWYATRNRDVQTHKYFAIATAFVSYNPADHDNIVPPIEFAMSCERAGDRRLEPLHFLSRYGQDRRPRYAFTLTDRDQWPAWHSEFRRELSRAIGLDRFLPRLRVSPGPVDRMDGYTRLGLTIETAPGLFVPAFLLIPEGLDGPGPAVLCANGHGIGMNDLVALDEKGNPRTPGEGYQHDFAIQSVRAGFVTLAFEMAGFGRRRDTDFHKDQKMWNHCEQPSKNALHWGMSMTGLRVWDAMRMIDYLQSRPEVRPDAIGMVGISGGGLVTQFTAALDDRIKAACVSGYCNRYDACILCLHHCIDNYMPGMGLLGDNDDVACLIAPRGLLIESGTKDPIFPIAATRAAVRKLERCYALLGEPDRLEVDIFEKSHEFSGAKTWTFFTKHLGRPGRP